MKICVFSQFATSFVYASTIPKGTSFNDDGCSSVLSEQTILNSSTKLPKYISIKYEHGKIRLRPYPAVMRIHNSRKKEGHEREYLELQLFTYWRDETLFYAKEMEKCTEVYQNKLEEICRNKNAIFPGEGKLDLLENFDLEKNKPQHVYNTLDNQRQQEEEDDLALGATDDPEFSFAYADNLCEHNMKAASTLKMKCLKKKKCISSPEGVYLNK